MVVAIASFTGCALAETTEQAANRLASELDKTDSISLYFVSRTERYEYDYSDVLEQASIRISRGRLQSV